MSVIFGTSTFIIAIRSDLLSLLGSNMPLFLTLSLVPLGVCGRIFTIITSFSKSVISISPPDINVDSGASILMHNSSFKR